MDPANVVDVAEGQICSLIFQGLVRFSPEGRIEPDAAARWDISEDGLRYVFHLDPEARFSDGRPLTARDVVASFERVLAPDSPSPRTWVLDRIRGAEAFGNAEAGNVAGLAAPDDSTVTIEIVSPFRPFLELLGMPAACIVPEGAGEDDELIGSGPWRLAEWRRGDVIRLERNPHAERSDGDIAEVRFRIIPEAFTRIAEFEAGTLDVLKIPLAELNRFLEDDRFGDQIQSRPELRVTYIGLNTTKGPLADIRVRKALNMAIDVDRLVEVLTQGKATRAKGAIPPSLGGFEERPPYPYDVAAAKQLLAAAGLPDGFEMEIWQRDSPEGNRLVEAVQGYLAEVGIRARIVKREWSAFKEAVSQGRVDAFFLDWYADYPDGENFIYPLFHSDNRGGGGNRAFLSNAEVDALIEQSQRTNDPQRSYALYARVDSMVYDLAPWIYLYFPNTFVVVSPRVQGYVYPALYLGEDFASVRKS